LVSLKINNWYAKGKIKTKSLLLLYVKPEACAFLLISKTYNMKKLYTLIVLTLLSASTFGQLIINEVLYDPSNDGLLGDANGDGVYDQEFDSFIEFVNTGLTNLEVSGYTIWDDISNGEPVFTFPPETWVPPNGAIVVFGGPTLTGDFGGAIVLATSNENGMNLNNSGEVIVIQDDQGNEILSFDSDALSNNPNESYTRNPDITGEFEQSNDNSPLLFSPGTMVDGSPFSTAFIVEGINVQGEGGATSIETPSGTLQMEATVVPAFATDQSVTWSLANGTTAASISETGLLTAIEDGLVTVVATANDGTGVMGSTDITISNQVSTVLVESIDVQGEGGATSIDVLAGTLQMEATVMPETATNQSVTWSLADGTTAASIATTGILTAIENGVVTVIASANDGSGVTGSVEITITNQSTGIEDQSKEAVSVYPNPANNQITLRTSAIIKSIEVIDLTGKAVMDIPMVRNSLDVSSLNRGIYILKAYTDSGIITSRFVKM
jgi:hypothetical protein